MLVSDTPQLVPLPGRFSGDSRTWPRRKPPRRELSRAARRRNGKLATDRSCSPDRDLPVAWDGCASIERGITPDRVPATFTDRFAAVLEKMSLELLALHAARSIVTCSACPPPIGGSLPSSR